MRIPSRRRRRGNLTLEGKPVCNQHTILNVFANHSYFEKILQQQK